ncbi:GIY-YIG nuclease family protein [Halobellus rufus]|uniref:GIY-YIG nuclease family protein n=1 Tax=Halobellus rufus TaxID=1448860 RepID=UPI0006792AD0|nr:GIY-YIG nuclease family protein [Halobellus rufus]
MREADDGTNDTRALVVDPAAIAAGEDPLGIGAGTAPPGSYVLCYSTDAPLTVEIGALGAATFEAGAYAYVGSAFGPNGLGRVDRHRRVAAGDHDVRHWHVDYFGGHPDVSLAAVIAAPHADVECRLASGLRERAADPTGGPAVPLPGFGASDCACATHLIGASDVDTLRSMGLEAVASVRE